jgi:hypothetical protein
MKGSSRVLVVLPCETRAWELTAESLTTNVLEQLGADLALCVGDREQPNPLYERAKYVWRFSEPDDWADALDRIAGNPRWRALLEVDRDSLRATRGTGILVNGPADDPEDAKISSGGIMMCFRAFLKESLEQTGATDAYDWMVVTRSDLLWPLPHPDVRYLSDRHIYALDGERYGGVGDRHLILPRRFVDRFLRVPDPVFASPERLKQRIDRRRTVQGWSFVNPERFLASRLKDLGLWRRIRYLPYAPYTVRGRSDSTRWSAGVFDEELGYFVKYPSERERSLVVQHFIRDQESWRRYLAPIRGARFRRQVRLDYPKPGEYDRDAFPRFRGLPQRAFRSLRWTFLPPHGR